MPSCSSTALLHSKPCIKCLLYSRMAARLWYGDKSKEWPIWGGQTVMRCDDTLEPHVHKWADLWYGDLRFNADPRDSFPHNMSVMQRGVGSAGKRTRPWVQCPNNPNSNMAVQVTSDHTYARKYTRQNSNRTQNMVVAYRGSLTHKPITARYRIWCSLTCLHWDWLCGGICTVSMVQWDIHSM